MKSNRSFFDRRLPLVASILALSILTAGWSPALANDKPARVPPEDALRVANALSAAFEYAAETISPAVVTIKSVKHFKPTAGRRSTPMPQLPEGTPFDNDLLRRFFEQLPERQLPQEGLGSGVIVNADGYILTNNHVVGGADEVTVTLHDGRDLRAKVVGTDPMSDLAVIRVKAQDLPAATLGSSEKLKVGEWVVAAGNPFNLSNTITAGIVSAKGRSNVRIAEYEDFIQTDAAINPGNSGGALVNLRGEVVGINTAIASRGGGNNGVGFAIPIDMAKTIMESLIQSGHVTRGWLGCILQPLDENLAKSFGYDAAEGALIAKVQPDGPAEEAGLKDGDIVTAYDGTKIKDMTQFRNLVAAAEPGSKIRLDVFRDGRTKAVTVKLGTRPDGEVAANTGNDSADELGLDVANLTPETARSLGLKPDTRGVVITDVDPDSAAARAGLERGNLILNVGSTPVSSVSEFQAQLAKHELKAGIRLLVQAGDLQRFVLLRVEE